jgi:hypothetical protein
MPLLLAQLAHSPGNDTSLPPLKHINVLHQIGWCVNGYLSSRKVLYLHKGGPELLWIEDVVESATSGLSPCKMARLNGREMAQSDSGGSATLRVWRKCDESR